MTQYIDKDAVAEIVKKIFELLIEEDNIKPLLPKISNDASNIYEGFMFNLSDLYKYANSEYRDRIINVVVDNIMLDNLIEVKGVDIDEELGYIFPKLRESEDEESKKWILEYLHDGLRKSDEQFKDHFKTAIAWLEKQGEQGPTPKFKIGDIIHKIGENTVFPRTIEKIEDGDYVCNNSHSFVNIKFQDDYELVEQKPAWSEDDESMLTRCIGILGKCYMGELPTKVEEELDWLKSLKDRVQPQPKQEWSEEDEHCIELLLPIIDSSSLIPKNRKKCKKFLKSLKPNHWKPSEEQMEALKKRTHGLHESSETRKALESLINDLEKL